MDPSSFAHAAAWRRDTSQTSGGGTQGDLAEMHSRSTHLVRREVQRHLGRRIAQDEAGLSAIFVGGFGGFDPDLADEKRRRTARRVERACADGSGQSFAE